MPDRTKESPDLALRSSRSRAARPPRGPTLDAQRRESFVEETRKGRAAARSHTRAVVMRSVRRGRRWREQIAKVRARIPPPCSQLRLRRSTTPADSGSCRDISYNNTAAECGDKRARRDRQPSVRQPASVRQRMLGSVMAGDEPVTNSLPEAVLLPVFEPDNQSPLSEPAWSLEKKERLPNGIVVED